MMIAKFDSSFAFSTALTKLIFLSQTQILIQAAYTRPAKLYLKLCQGDEEEDDDDNEVLECSCKLM